MLKEREKTLLGIYRIHHQWMLEHHFFCHKGCAACCSNRVMATEIEARRIIDYCAKKNKLIWLQERLAKQKGGDSPQLTNNGFARNCLAQVECDELIGMKGPLAACPLLEDGCCFSH